VLILRRGTARFTGAVKKACKLGVADAMLPKVPPPSILMPSRRAAAAALLPTPSGLTLARPSRQLFTSMVNGGIKAQTQIKVLTSQVQTLKKNGKKRGASSGGSTAGKPAGKATAEENNGELRTAIGIQTPSQIMAVIITLNSFLSLFSYATTTFMCPKYDMDDTNACTNVAMQKAVDKKGNKVQAFKISERPAILLMKRIWTNLRHTVMPVRTPQDEDGVCR